MAKLRLLADKDSSALLVAVIFGQDCALLPADCEKSELRRLAKRSLQVGLRLAPLHKRIKTNGQPKGSARLWPIRRLARMAPTDIAECSSLERRQVDSSYASYASLC